MIKRIEKGINRTIKELTRMFARMRFKLNIRNVFFHIIVLCIAYKVLLVNPIRFFKSEQLGIYYNAAFVLFFYIHSFLLLPFLLQQKKAKKYLLLTMACYIVAVQFNSWFQAVHSSMVVLNEDGTRPLPLDFFLTKDWFLGGIIFKFPIYVFIGFLSYVYYFLLNDVKKFLPYAEGIVNVLVLTAIFRLLFDLPQIDFPEILLFAIISAVFYANVFVVTPILIRYCRWPKYFLYLIAISACYYLLMMTIFNVFKIDFFSFKNRFHFKLTLLGILVPTLLLSFIYGYVRLKIKSKEKSLDLKLEAKESELQLLKSQVNPHFLFNTLNTLYATALEENATKTAESTAKLASLIRYMQEDIDKDFIPLENEIKYLQDYIAIQKLRCSIEPEINTKFKHIDNYHISPGLLIPFVENAFKYGIDPSKKSKLSISVVCNEDTINFKCINSYDENFKVYYKEQGFGIGIKNAKKRLELVYSRKHIFKIQKENNIFSVQISIQTKI